MVRTGNLNLAVRQSTMADRGELGRGQGRVMAATRTDPQFVAYMPTSAVSVTRDTKHIVDSQSVDHFKPSQVVLFAALA